MKNILINGQQLDSISVLDRGFNFGDGVFETMAMRQGRITLWQDHWQRLTLGCEKLSIHIPDKDLIEDEINLLTKNNKKCVIKLIVTRGVGDRGYLYSNNQTPSRVLIQSDFPSYPPDNISNGVHARYCDTAISENKNLAGIKHLNRLEQILARNEWHDNKYQEGFMLNHNGHIIEGTMSNVFIVKDGSISTPDLSLCGVAGVMRKNIISIAQENGITICEKTVDKIELENADEVFISNSLFGIWPVTQIDTNNNYTIGNITLELIKKANALLNN